MNNEIKKINIKRIFTFVLMSMFLLLFIFFLIGIFKERIVV